MTADAAIGTKPITVEDRRRRRLAIELVRRRRRDSFEAFFRAFPPRPRYVYGRHTLKLIEVCQRATERLERGESTRIVVNMPFRHGKSDIGSRLFPAWFLIRNPDLEVILAAYNSHVAEHFSLDAQAKFEEAAPGYGLRLSKKASALKSWRIRDRLGAMHAAGMDSSIRGKGANLLILDDALKTVAEANSPIMRDRIWEGFSGDLMTRVAPVNIVMLIMHRMHPDDIPGRILARNDTTNDQYDPEFPKFEFIRFPIQDERPESEGGYVTETNPEGWLFPERFSPEWYRVERSVLGWPHSPYQWAAQGLQDPVAKEGQLFRTDKVQIVDVMPEGLRWRRGWDLASTTERVKDNPDYTVGTLAAMRGGVLYVADEVRGRWSALERDKEIVKTAIETDEGKARVMIEVVGGYTDCLTRIKAELDGKAIVEGVRPRTSLENRAEFLERLFEQGRVVLLRGGWNGGWIREFGGFPNAAPHDDRVASLLAAVEDLASDSTGALVFPMIAPASHLTHGDPTLKREGNRWRQRVVFGETESWLNVTLHLGIFHSSSNQSGAVWVMRDEDGDLCVYRTYKSHRAELSASDHALAIARLSGEETYSSQIFHAGTSRIPHRKGTANVADVMRLYQYRDGEETKPILPLLSRCRDGADVEDVGGQLLRSALHAAVAVADPQSSYWTETEIGPEDVEAMAERRVLFVAPRAYEFLEELMTARYRALPDGSVNDPDREVDSDNALRRAFYGLAATGL